MAMLLSSPASASPPTALSHLNRQQQSSISFIHLPSLSRSSPPSLSHTFNPLRYTLPSFSSQSFSHFSCFSLHFSDLRSFIGHHGITSFSKSNTGNRNAAFRILCYAPAPLTTSNLQWISTVSSMFVHFLYFFNRLIYLSFIIFSEIEFHEVMYIILAFLNSIMLILVIFFLFRFLATERNVLSDNSFFLSDLRLIFQTECLFSLAVIFRVCIFIV